jgi:hypothetical protein
LDDEICIPRADELADQLMNTGDMALVTIDPLSKEAINAFRNIQIGYLLMEASMSFLGE